jgi:hypothetical protein
MKKLNNKTIGTALILGAVAYYIYSRKKAGKPLNPFSKSSSFTGDEHTFWEDTFVSFSAPNPDGKRVVGCQVYKGDVAVNIPHRLANGDVIVRTGGGSTVVCPPNQSGRLGV